MFHITLAARQTINRQPCWLQQDLESRLTPVGIPPRSPRRSGIIWTDDRQLRDLDDGTAR